MRQSAFLTRLFLSSEHIQPSHEHRPACGQVSELKLCFQEDPLLKYKQGCDYVNFTTLYLQKFETIPIHEGCSPPLHNKFQLCTIFEDLEW